MFVHRRQRLRRLVGGNRIVPRDRRAQSVATLPQHLGPETQLAGLARGFAIEHAVGIGRALMRVVAPPFPFPAEVHARVLT